MNIPLREKDGIRSLAMALAATAAVATQAVQSATRLPDRNLEQRSGFRVRRVCSVDGWVAVQP